MAREHSQNEDALLDGGAPADAQGAVGSTGRTGVSSASAARTRVLGGETVEFKTVDYRPPQGVRAGAPQAVSPAAGADLGRAEGVASLRRAGKPADDEGERGLTTRHKVVIAVVLAVVAVAVFVGGYHWAKAFIGSLDDPTPAATSATYATDAYTLFAVCGDDGVLETAYLAYVDSINERVEFAALAANTYCSTKYVDADGGFEDDLAQIFASRGLAGLVEGVASLSDVAVAAALVLDRDQMEQVFSLPRGDSTAGVSDLCAQLQVPGQEITPGALRGLLVTIRQVPPENHLVMTAPADATEVDGAELEVLRQQEWLTLVRGMRDPMSDVSRAS